MDWVGMRSLVFFFFTIFIFIYLALLGLSCNMWDGTWAPALRAQSLNRCTTRDVPGKVFGTGQPGVHSLAASSLIG